MSLRDLFRRAKRCECCGADVTHAKSFRGVSGWRICEPCKDAPCFREISHGDGMWHHRVGFYYNGRFFLVYPGRAGPEPVVIPADLVRP